jgi:shikimate dehydrogenase
MQAVDWIDSDAVEIGAVNTVAVDGERLLAYNTDAAGFLAPLQHAIGDLRDARIAIVGAGGSANAVTWALSKERANVTVFARDESKAANLARRFGVSSNRLSDASFANYDLLVNTTPLGSGREVHSSPVSIDQLDGVSLVYDLVYNPIETLLLKSARSAGCRTLNGLKMLVAQAALQFRLWTGNCAPLDVMQAAAATALSDN